MLDFPISDLQTLGWILFIGVAVGVIISAAFDKVVVFYDVEDLEISAIALFAPLLAYYLFEVSPFESHLLNVITNYVCLLIVGSIALLALYSNYRNAICHTRSVPVGIFIGTFKLLFVIVGLGALMGAMDNADRRSGKNDIVGALVILALLVMLFHSLVNGERVYKEKKWKMLGNI